MRALILLAVLFAPLATADEVYKWKDAKGVIHYTDKPPTPTSKPHRLPELQTFGDIPPEQTAARKAGIRGPLPFGGSGPKVKILSPAADATLTGSDGKFTVMVDVVLAEGQTLNYYLDGELLNPAPTPSTAFLYERVEKGDHLLSAAVVDVGGKEVSRSEPIIVHVNPLPTSEPPTPAP